MIAKQTTRYTLPYTISAETEEEAIIGLHSCREFCGWFDCEVSNTIYEQVGKYYGMV